MYMQTINTILIEFCVNV